MQWPLLLFYEKYLNNKNNKLYKQPSVHILCKTQHCISSLTSFGKSLCQFSSTLSSTSPTPGGLLSVVCQSINLADQIGVASPLNLYQGQLLANIVRGAGKRGGRGDPLPSPPKGRPNWWRDSQNRATSQGSPLAAKGAVLHSLLLSPHSSTPIIDLLVLHFCWSYSIQEYGM